MKIKCNKCGDIIEGDKKGTYITCKCKAIAIDETPYFWRIIGNREDFEEIIEEDKLSIKETQIAKLKEYVKEDEIYQNYKNGIEPSCNDGNTDFEYFCIDHCDSIEKALKYVDDWGKFKQWIKKYKEAKSHGQEDNSRYCIAISVDDLLAKMEELEQLHE